MKRSVVKVIVGGVVCCGGVVGLTACNHEEPKVETSKTAAFKPGVPGGTTVETTTVTTKILKVDREARKVTVAMQDGEKEVIKCGPEVRNFDRIHVGDEVMAVLVKEMVVSMAHRSAPGAQGEAVMAVRAPEGGQPAAVVAGTVEVIAKVSSLDTAGRKATLMFPDGSVKTIDVRPDVDMSKGRVGDKVYIRYTEAVALSVEKKKED